MGCKDCPLNGRKKMNTRGEKDANFLIVTDTPSEYNATRNQLLSKSATAALFTPMREAGFGKEDFVMHPAVRCSHDPDLFTRQDKKLIRDCCREHFLKVVEKMEPEVILPLGPVACQQVMGRPVKITKVRGVYEDNEEHGCGVLPLLNPGYVAMYPQHTPTMRSDCFALDRLVEFSYDTEAVEDETLGEYEFIDDLQFLIDEQPDVLSFDIETIGTRWYAAGAKILSMQFCTKPGKAYMLLWEHPNAEPWGRRTKTKLRRQLRTLLQNPATKVVGQNLKFDTVWVNTHVGFRYRIGGDTLMLFALIDENSMDKNQDSLVKMYVPSMAGYADSFNSKYDKSRMQDVPIDELLDYGCGDVDSCLRLYNVLRPRVMKDRKLFNHYSRVALPGLNAFVPIESQGLIIDDEEFERFTEHMTEVVSTQERELIMKTPRAVLRKHIRKGLKFSRADFVRDILFYHKGGFKLKPVVYTKKTQKLEPDKRLPSTSSKDHLPFFFEECPYTIDLAQHVKDARMLGTNIRRFKERYIVNDMVYPRYSLTTAVTGRTSSQDPNGQNFPKRGDNAKAYRKCFKAPDGYVILAADLSQAELRISADMANDHTMLRIYRDGGDIHKATACIVMGLTLKEFEKQSPEEQSLARFKAKAVNFGFIYGMGWRSFIIYAKTQYAVEFTEQEAQRIREGFFSQYSQLSQWHKNVRAIAKRDGQIRSYDGRIRHLPMIWSEEERVQQEAERQAINSPVQAFASFLGVMSMSRIDRNVNPEYLKLMSFVHDEIGVLVRMEHIVWGAKTLKYYMESNPLERWFNRKMKLPIIADVGFGRNLGQQFEMEGLDLNKPFDLDSIEGIDYDIPRQETPPENGRIITPAYMKMAA
jgi:uracil-DNA glycosylase family 4